MSANEVRVEIYRAFIEDHSAPTAAVIAERLGISSEDALEAFRELDEQDVIAFAPGTEEIWLAHPFCATPAAFQVRSGTDSWEGICIWDALGILAMLDRDGSVTTPCPDCGTDLLIAVEDRQVLDGKGLTVHFGVPAARWYEDVGYT